MDCSVGRGGRGFHTTGGGDGWRGSEERSCAAIQKSIESEIRGSVSSMGSCRSSGARFRGEGEGRDVPPLMVGTLDTEQRVLEGDAPKVSIWTFSGVYGSMVAALVTRGGRGDSHFGNRSVLRRRG